MIYFLLVLSCSSSFTPLLSVPFWTYREYGTTSTEGWKSNPNFFSTPLYISATATPRIRDDVGISAHVHYWPVRGPQPFYCTQMSTYRLIQAGTPHAGSPTFEPQLYKPPAIPNLRFLLQHRHPRPPKPKDSKAIFISLNLLIKRAPKMYLIYTPPARAGGHSGTNLGPLISFEEA